MLDGRSDLPGLHRLLGLHDRQDVGSHRGRVASLLARDLPQLHVCLADAAAHSSGDEAGGTLHHDVRVRLRPGDGGVEIGQPLQVVL